MTFVIMYAENGDIVASYKSREEALRDLATFVDDHPSLQDEIGLRPYEGGRPAGDFLSASELIAGGLRQPHLA